MRIFNKRVAGLLLLAGGSLLLQLPSGCAEFGLITALDSFDFCTVLNCEGSAFFDLCSPVPLLRDCL